MHNCVAAVSAIAAQGSAVFYYKRSTLPKQNCPLRMNISKPWQLHDITLAEVREHAFSMAVLPLGATEPHNFHLPYGTDTIEATELVSQCCAAAWEKSARIVQLPTLPYGTETNMQQFPLAMNIMPSTMHAILRDLTKSLENSGVSKLLIFNSHGGNEIKPILRELVPQTTVQLFLCNWYQMIRDVASKICQHPDDHAGEMETSLVMYFRPELVVQKEGGLRADAGAVRPFRYEALEKGWVSITRPWHLLTTNSGSGNPHSATSDKGRRLTEAIVARIAPFLIDLATADTTEPFPFQ